MACRMPTHLCVIHRRTLVYEIHVYYNLIHLAEPRDCPTEHTLGNAVLYNTTLNSQKLQMFVRLYPYI